jgi:SulP family sulfate permease
MASDIAILMNGQRPEAVVATTMAAISLSTVLTGLSLIGIGKAKLAKLVSYIPMPVIGGYLAFIGLFCVEAGLSLTSHMTISGFDTWVDLIFSSHAFILTLPAILSGAFLCYIARTYSHIAALPVAITILPVLFFVFIWAADISLDEARQFGWINESSAVADWRAVVGVYDLSAVNWSIIPTQFTVWVGMVIVVVFGSSLDVAAVEMGSGEDLDTDEQLVVIGASNVLSGALGGFTGSYIFTQTLLGFRSKFHSRSVALFLAGAQFIIFALSIDPLAYTPLFFFAATIIFIGFDLLLEWIIEVRHKLAMGEYIVLLVTFTSMIVSGMDQGFAIGVFCSLFNFVVTYVLYNPHSSAGLVSASIPRSRQLRRPQHVSILLRCNNLTCIGYINLNVY